MRLWSFHPKYLDPQGLVAVWREALLAQSVLRGETRGYRNHPQLYRFRCQPNPLISIGFYLYAVYAEAAVRGYSFDGSKIESVHETSPIPVTSGQLLYEWRHFFNKLSSRSPLLHQKWQPVTFPECHPLFQVCSGSVEPWERVPGN